MPADGREQQQVALQSAQQQQQQEGSGDMLRLWGAQQQDSQAGALTWKVLDKGVVQSVA